MKKLKARVFVGYMKDIKDMKDIGTIEVKGKKLIINLTDPGLQKDFEESPYDLEKEGEEAYQLLLGRFCRSSTIVIAPEE